MKNYYALFVGLCIGILNFSMQAQQASTFKKTYKNYFVMPDGITEEDYLAKTVIIKVKPEFRNYCSNDKIGLKPLQDALNELGVQQLSKKFPKHSPPEKPTNKLGQQLVDLSLIYQIKYNSNTSIEDAINRLFNTGLVEYACLYVLPKSLYTPNDTYTTSQYHLTNIKAFEAWDIEQGDTNVVIGISDTGFLLSHEDLGNVKYNYADPIDGQDNDNDGYVDNFNGWDISMDDNDPTYYQHSHGVGVASVASATTDNGKGISGVGFNCKYLPVKCIDDLAVMYINSYESIVYAADHGCTVVNCSWGGTFMPGQFGQDVITYATINKDVIVVASAGNNGNEDVFYPASLDYVFSIAGTDQSDVKWSGSCYGTTIDISAPGKSIYYASKNGGYSTSSGTSVAAPIVAGAIGLVRSYYPNLSALEVMQLLKSSSDNIDTIAGNASYQNKLGAGRLNIYKALTDSTSPGMAIWTKSLSDNNDENFYSNDTIEISGEFVNFLKATTNLSITLSSTNSNVTIISDSVAIGAVANLQIVDNNSSPFKVIILPSAATNETIELKVTFTDGTYSAFEYITFSVNQSYLNIVPNQISTTLTGNGRIGFNSTFATDGMSLSLEDYAMLYANSFMITDSTKQVSDAIYNEIGDYDSDFSTVDNIKEVVPAVYANKDYYTKFNDNNAASKLGAEISQRTFAWNETGYDKFLIVEYEIKNANAVSMDSIYAGLFTDWDIIYSTADAAYIDTTYKIGYARSQTHNVFAGVHLITDGDFISYAADMNGDNGSIGSYDGSFTNTEKYTALTILRDSAGYTGNTTYGEDVASGVSVGPFSLNAGASTKVAFAIMVGYSLSSLQSSALAADDKYELMYSPTAIIENQVNNGCNKDCNGQAEAAITGGAIPFTYQWNDADSQTTATATNLCAGNYTVIVGDANGVFDTLSVSITEPTAITDSMQVSNESSQNACDGSAIVTPSGGTPPYTYLWNDSLSQTDSMATGLCSGQYVVMVMDANGCTHYDSVTVSFTTSIAELTEGGMSNFYPNPSAGPFTLSLLIKKAGVYDMGVYAVNGDKVLSVINGNLKANTYLYTIDLSSMPEGIYFVQLTSAENSQAKKVIVKR